MNDRATIIAALDNCQSALAIVFYNKYKMNIYNICFRNRIFEKPLNLATCCKSTTINANLDKSRYHAVIVSPNKIFEDKNLIIATINQSNITF